MTTPRPGSRFTRSLYSFWGDYALVHARASVWGVQGVPGASLGHPCGSPGSHFRSTGRLQGLLGAPGSSRGALWGALGSPRGVILGSSPPCRKLVCATICYSFGASAPGGIFAAPEGHAILSIFATLVAPGLLTRHSRIPGGTQSCAYLRHILHLRLGHRLPRNLRPSNLMHICYTFLRRKLWDWFGDKFLGGFLPWSTFERRVVHMFLKFARAGCGAHQLRLGSHAIIYFFRKQHIVRLG